MKELLVIVPAYNEQENIVNTIADLKKHCPDVDYIVIDDCSTDDTVKVCEQNNINCLKLPINLGLDGVFQTGNKFAYLNGYEMLLQFDGDGQHNAVYIPELVKKLKEGYDFVAASRFIDKKKHMSLRMLGSRAISFAFFLTTGKKYKDPTAGMRIMNRNIMKRIAYDINCGEEPDTWAYLVRKGAKFCEIPVEMNEREAGTSYLTISRSIVYMVRILISIVFINLFRGRKKIGAN